MNEATNETMMEEVSGVGDLGKLSVPSDLAKSTDLFRQVLSFDTWQNVLTEDERNNLKLLLPQTGNDEETLRLLFAPESTSTISDPMKQVWKTLFGVTKASKQRKDKLKQHQLKRKRDIIRLQRNLFVSRKKLSLTDKTYSRFIPDCKGPHSNLQSKINRHYRKTLLDCQKNSKVKLSSSSSSDEDEEIDKNKSRSEQAYMRMLRKHKRRRIENIHLPELDTSDITLKSIVARTDPKLLSIYSDVIDKVDKEPPFDLHAYLAPPPASTSATSNSEANNVMTTTTASTATATTTTTTTTNTVTPATPTAVDKPKKEPSKPKLTSYTIQPSTEAERNLFRLQETERYENPHKAYTYNIRSIESTVGPVKGIYKKDQGNHSKVREHFLLKSSRPHYVTILSIVRDSASRLPEAGGTRADICMLVRDSQYIVEDATDAQVHAAVSGALDRLHYEKDPCVKYDSSKKVWVYLHRNRTRDEFEQIHLAGAHAATTQKKGQKQTPKAQSRLSVSPGTASKKSKSKNITIPQRSQQNSPTAKSLLNTLSEPITGSLLLDTSDIKLGEPSAVLKLESDQPVRNEQGLDLMLDSSKLSSAMIPLHNSTLPPDMIFSSDENSSGNEFASDSS